MDVPFWVGVGLGWLAAAAAIGILIGKGIQYADWRESLPRR